MVGRKRGSTGLTPLELRILQVLWSEGPGTVQEVQKNLSGELAYTTVQTMLNVLHRKGRLRRKLIGRAYTYHPVESRETVLGHAIRELAERLFGGSSEELVLSLVQSKQLDLAKIAELQRKLAQAGQPGEAAAHE
jgi:predicted transcriptional regulator